MKRYLVGVLVMAALSVSSALATQIKIGNSYGPYQTGSGGEFTLVAVGLNLSGYAATTSGVPSSAGTLTFQSFCLESSQPPEYLNLNTTYNAAVNSKAINGGVGPGGDPLSVGTGWLYSQFAAGTLAGYNYGAGRTTTAGQLQNAIWWLESEGGVVYSAGNPFMLAAVTHFGSQAAAQADGAAAYGVYALNLTLPSGALAQDQIYFRPVPDNAFTIILLGAALASLALFRRR